MKAGTILSNNLRYIDEDVFAVIKRYVIHEDDLYVTIAGTIGDVGEVPPKFDGMNLTENAAKIVFRESCKRYFMLALKSHPTQVQFHQKTNQMAQPKLALKRISATIIALPPIEEQKRIVAKVDELMALCNEMETQQEKSRTGSHLPRALRPRPTPHRPQAPILQKTLEPHRQQLRHPLRHPSIHKRPPPNHPPTRRSRKT